MLALEPANITLPDSEISNVIDIILRYTHGQEYSENELQTVLSLSRVNLFVLEEAFLENHIEYVKSQCVPILANPRFKDSVMNEQLLSQVSSLWTNIVCPQNLLELGILTSEGLDRLRIVFATIVRAFFDINHIISWLATDATTRHLHEAYKIGLDEEINAALAQIIPSRIESYIQTNWKGVYASDILGQVESWVLNELVSNIEQVLAGFPGDAPPKIPVEQIISIAKTALARLRIEELYDIIRDECRLGLEDLAQALADRPDLREETVQSFTKQCYARLLNGASDTVEIIQMYLLIVQAFSLLDPQGILLEKVSQPIRLVLKDRSDTSMRLAEGLFGDINSPLSFLFTELQRQSKPQTNRGTLEAFETWVPDPIDTPVDFVRKQTQDSVSTLIDLYDNKEVFIKQFVNLFSTELLNQPFDRKQSVPRLVELFDLLGARFGVSNMQKMAVMLEDVRRSDVANHQIQRQAAESGTVPSNFSVLSPLILSRLYWPNITQSVPKGNPQLLPLRFQGLLEEYRRRWREQPDYEDMDLKWLPNQGRVRVNLSLADRTLDMVVQPYEAILVSAFSEDNEDEETKSPALTLSELAERTNLEEPQLLAAIQFWSDHGVLGTQGEKYKVLETAEEAEEQRMAHGQVVSGVDGTGNGGATTAGSASGSGSKPADPWEEMHVYWSYIVGMLTNLGTLPLDKIHSFLVMFVPDEDPYVRSKQELENYLLAMVDENKLKVEDGKYSLVKK